ncbi:MAG: hypothetical protein Q7U53_20020 [Anaerolineaceae bacterium]|nr:hypothetical protein [Anaerolineaceae bacterium]
MFQTNLRPTDPFSLILTCDLRKNVETPTHDNVWEIQFDGGELGGLSLYSTLGLRALSMRITPIFSNLHETKVNIKQFTGEPIITNMYQNYAKISVEVFDNINSDLEYWIPNPSSICGQVTICNNTDNVFSGNLLFMVSLKPFSGGDLITGFQSDLNYYLSGKTKNIFPTFFLSGSTQAGKLGQTSIENNFEINAKENQRIQWCLAFDEERSQSIDRIFRVLKLDFEKEITRIGLFNQRDRFLIETGDKDWDHAFLASQNSASQLLVKASDNSKKIHVVESRHPEKTIFTSDNLNHPLMEGISPLQLWYFLQVLPNTPEMVEDVFNTLIESQKNDGFIPNHTDPANFQTRFHSFPILARIASEIISIQENHAKAEKILKKLILYLRYWFSVSNDKLTPYWENPMQSLYEDLPIQNKMDLTGDGIDSKWVVSPFLLGLLISECEICLTLADDHQLSFPDRDWLEDQKKSLLMDLKNSWNSKHKFFTYRDISTKKSPGKITLMKTNASGFHALKKTFRTAQRLNIKIISKKDVTRNSIVEIEGSFEKNKIFEVINARQFSWSTSGGLASTENVFDQILSINLIQVPDGNSLEVSTSNFSQIDLSSFIPLLVKNKKINYVDSIENHWIKDKFLDRYGLPFVPRKSDNTGTENQNLVDLPLNTLILEGLILNQKYELARNLFTNLMKGLILNLRKSKKFYKLYDASNGACRGEYNIINGMIPLKVFFKLIGINRWTENEIEFSGTSVFKKEIKVQYRGLKVVSNQKGHSIFTSGGKVIEQNEKNFYKIKIPS